MRSSPLPPIWADAVAGMFDQIVSVGSGAPHWVNDCGVSVIAAGTEPPSAIRPSQLARFVEQPPVVLLLPVDELDLEEEAVVLVPLDPEVPDLPEVEREEDPVDVGDPDEEREPVERVD